MDILTQYIILVCCLIGSAFFSASEIAYMGLTRLQVHQMLEQKRGAAKVVEALKKYPQKLIITILIGNNLLNVLGSAMATSIATAQFGDAGLGIAVGVMTFLVLLFGEILPKSYAATHAKGLALRSARFMRLLQIILTPLVWFFETINKVVFAIFGAKETSPKLTQEDVMDTIALSEQDGALKAKERELLHNVIEFNDTQVMEIMTPREKVVSLDHGMTFKKALESMIDSGFSRVPVYKNDPDNVVGTLHIKDAFKALASGKSVRTIGKLIEDPLFVPETQSIEKLLRMFQRKKMHFAVVVNEYGSVQGVITLEDLLEELVGEIYDETDVVERQQIRKIKNKTYAVKGDCIVEELNDELGKVVIPTHEDYSTVAGYVIHKFGRLPRREEEIRTKLCTVTIVSATKKQVKSVRLKIK